MGFWWLPTLDARVLWDRASERRKIVVHMNTNATFNNQGGVYGGVLKWPFASPGGDENNLSPLVFLNFQI